VLSRQDQDLLTDQDEQVQARESQLIRPEWIRPEGVLRASLVQTRSQRNQDQLTLKGNTNNSGLEISTNLSTNQDDLQTDDLFTTWDKDIVQDTVYQEVKKTLVEGQRRFPASLARLCLSITECNLD
jgi:hypothetical protein